MIPIHDGKYHVWTKRVGNNPKMKVLLLHGGPAATDEFFESFDSFLPKEGIEYYYYDQLLALTIAISLRIRVCGRQSDLWKKLRR